MSDFTQLFEVDERQVLQFFFTYLREETLASGVVEAETLYVARILAHYSQVSCFDSVSGLPRGLGDFLDNFVTKEEEQKVLGTELLEIAGSQILALAGFFRDQTQEQHRLARYDQLGAHFFGKASQLASGRKRARMLGNLSEHFMFWTASCRNVSRTMRDERYLIRQ